MPRATSWEPRHTPDPTPQNHQIRADLIRDVEKLTGPKFRARRAALGMSYSQAAEICEVTPRTVTRWEKLPDEVPVSASEAIQAVAEASAKYYALAAENGSAVIYSYGWRTLPESGLCLPESWWHAVVGMVPGLVITWAKGHPAAQPNNEAARKRAARKKADSRSGNGDQPGSTRTVGKPSGVA